jgi:hypothetical protein
MNRAFINEDTLVCNLGGARCINPDCRTCNAPLIMREEVRGALFKGMRAQQGAPQAPEAPIVEVITSDAPKDPAEPLKVV